MTETVPPQVLIDYHKFSEALMELEKSIVKLNEITPEQKAKMTSLERANLDITVVSLVNSFYCLHSATLGKNPEDEDAVGVEFRRWKEIKDRLKQLEERRFWPKVNKRTAGAFIRNALFDVDEHNNTVSAEQLADAGVEFAEFDEGQSEEEYDLDMSQDEENY